MPKDPSAPKSRYFNQTAWRAVSILEHLAANDGHMSLTELSSALGSSKSSLFPILRTLEEAGYVRSVPRGGYDLTSKVLALSQSMASRRRLVSLFDEVSRSAVARAAEAMQLAVLDHDVVVCIASRANSEDLVHLSVEIGQRLPVHATALGKALLSGLTDEVIHERIGGRPLSAVTSKTIVSFDQLLAEVERTRATGFAEDWQELSEGSASIASPVREASGTVAASVGFIVPTFRANPDAWARLKKYVLGAAAELSAQLGYRGDG